MARVWGKCYDSEDYRIARIRQGSGSRTHSDVAAILSEELPLNRPPQDGEPRRAILAAVFLAVGLISGPTTSIARQSSPPGDETGREGDKSAPDVANIVVGAPDDLSALWKKLIASDWVLLKGPEYRKLLNKIKNGGVAGEGTRPWVIESVAVRGDVRDEQAKLTVELGATLNEEGPTWVVARLDGLTFTRVREGEREWPVRLSEDGAWQVELRGKGKHAVEIELITPVVPGTEGHRLEVPIPEAASTRFDIQVGPKVLDAVVGAKGRVAIEPIDRGARTRLSAHLSPRSRIELTWRLEADPGRKLPPLLAAQGEIELDIDRGFADATATWLIRSDRGIVRDIRLRLDPAEELLELKLDDQPLPVEGKRERGSELVVVPLTEPLRAGGSKRLTFKTRRALAGEKTPRWDFRGYSIENAAEQRGVLAINQGDGLWIEGEPGRELRRIDPRADLPDHAKGTATVLAYQFLDQPFELRIRVASSPPRVRASSRTAVTIEAGRVRVDAWFEYQLTRGKTFEAKIEVPPGLEIESVGPDDEIESSRALSIDERSGRNPRGNDYGSRVLAARLRKKIREGGTFRLHLVGLGPLDPSGRIGLFRPLDAIAAGGGIVVFAGRGLVVDLNEDDPARAAFILTAPRLSTDWPAAERTAGGPVAALWLRHETDPDLLPLRVTYQTRTVHHETALALRIETTGIEGRQETICHVHHGMLTHLDVAIPRSIEGLWETEGLEISARSRHGEEADGSIRYRLTLAREAVETARLRFRYRLALAPGLSERTATEIEAPWIRLLEGVGGPLKFSVSANPEIELDPRGGGWRKPVEESSANEMDFGSIPRFEATVPATATHAPTIAAKIAPRAELPKLIASRVWLRTTLSGDGGARTTVWYRFEKHDGSFSFSLPEGAIPLRAIDPENSSSPAVDRLENPGCFRVRFAAGARTVPKTVGIDFEVPARFAASSRTPPILLDGGVSQWTVWELRVPWSRAAVGTPSSWDDANEWTWAKYVFKRRPARGDQALVAWLTGPDLERSAAAILDATRRDLDSNSYLFERPGAPIPLRVWIASRAVLVAIFSGAILALGMVVLAFRPAALWIWATVLGLVAAIVAAEDPSAAVLGVQVGSIGFVLTIFAALMRRFVDRRAAGRPAAFIVGESTRSAQAPAASPVGSDDSTVIRPRSTTIDHIHSPQVAAPVRAGQEAE